jgi:hypothetical protein
MKEPFVLQYFRQSSVRQHYFRQSPFRSLSFVATTVIVALFLAWAFHVESSLEVRGSCASGAVFGLALLPPLAWVYALVLHWEIRNLIESNIELPPNSRLDQLHQTLVLMTILVSVLIIEGIKLTCWK